MINKSGKRARVEDLSNKILNLLHTFQDQIDGDGRVVTTDNQKVEFINLSGDLLMELQPEPATHKQPRKSGDETCDDLFSWIKQQNDAFNTIYMEHDIDLDVEG